MHIPTYYIGHIQAFIFPLFLIGIYYLSKKIHPLPKIFFILIGIVGLTCATYTYGTIGVHQASVLVSVLNDDSSGGLSRKLRLEIEKWALVVGGESIRQLYDSAPNRRIMESIKKSDTLFLVSGNEKRLVITFNDQVQWSQVQVPQNSEFPKLAKLKLVTEIPNIDIPMKPFAATAQFVGYLSAHDETGWEAAGRIQGGWITQAHRAYPWFKQGTLLLQKMLTAQEGYQSGYGECAERSFIQAFRYASPLQARTLRMAIANNLGVLYYIQGWYEEQAHYRQRGRKNIKWASYGFPRKKIKGVTYVGTVARKNIAALNKIENRKKTRKGDGKRRDHKRSPKKNNKPNAL